MQPDDMRANGGGTPFWPLSARSQPLAMGQKGSYPHLPSVRTVGTFPGKFVLHWTGAYDVEPHQEAP